MYQIRARTDTPILQVQFSGRVAAPEALRAISQASALARAGGISSCLCDIRHIAAGPELDALPALAAALGAALLPKERVAVVCERVQLPLVRRFLRGCGGALGAFTREQDAEDWLATAPGARMSITARRHVALGRAVTGGVAHPAVSSKAG